MAFSRIVVDGTTLTRDNFIDPPKEMGILPFWFWNGDLEEDELFWQMEQYYDRGIRGLFLHGRFGLTVPYLSEGWFDKTKFVVEKAKAIGLDIWIYDEMNWPSGTAEKQVLDKFPHLKQRYLELVVLHVQGPLFTFLEATDDRYVNTGNSTPIAAYACSAEEFDRGEISELIDLTPNLSFNAVIPWEAPAGDWKLLYFLEKQIDYYIDALNPEATKRFLEVTHDGYKAAVGEEFGKTVPGFYTDEPAMHYYHVGMDNWVVPWSSQMFKIFRDHRGYDLKPHLPALYADMGPETERIRYDFWRTLSDQYTNTYYKQIRDWCDENDVIFTGHLLFEEWLRASARCEGNIFNHLKQMHMTGVDHLYPKIGTEETPDQHVALKLASSAAHHFGSARLLCESMGGTYWDCSLERMKWIANWEYVLGVTVFNNHGYHYSIEGERKRDWPPSQFYHHTWWKYYDQFTEYMARLGHILSGGRHVAKLLMLYPLNSIWTNYTPQSKNQISDAIEQDFYYLTDTLLRMHFDFDYTDEEILADAKVSDGQIHINEESFDVMVLPPLTHIKISTLEKLESFVAEGGKVLSSTFAPSKLLEYTGNDEVSRLNALFGHDVHEKLEAFNNDSIKQEIMSSKAGNVQTFSSSALKKWRPRAQLWKALESWIKPDVTIDADNVFYLHRVKDDFDLYYLVNTSQNDLGKVEISFEHQGKPELWNANTGEIQAVEVFEFKDDRLHITLEFPATESHIVIITDEKVGKHVASSNVTVESFDGSVIRAWGNPVDTVKLTVQDGTDLQEIELEAVQVSEPVELPPEMHFETEDRNVFLVDQWKMLPIENDDDSKKYAELDLDDSSWIDVKMGAWEMQLPSERDEQIYPQSLWYRAWFQIDDIPTDSALLIDGFSGSHHQIFINGRLVESTPKRSALDAEIMELDIQAYLKTGKNLVAVNLTAERRTDGILDLLKILGHLRVDESGETPSIAQELGKIECSSWTEQGYPFYSGTGVYTTEVELDPDFLSGKVFLVAQVGEDVMEVSVNGGEPKVLPWHPYQIDIGHELKPGRNRIELKVTNTLINILEGVRESSGFRTPPKLVAAPSYVIPVE